MSTGTPGARGLDKLNDAITAALGGTVRGDAMAKAMAEELRMLGAGVTATDVDAGVEAVEEREKVEQARRRERASEAAGPLLRPVHPPEHHTRHDRQHRCKEVEAHVGSAAGLGRLGRGQRGREAHTREMAQSLEMARRIAYQRMVRHNEDAASRPRAPPACSNARTVEMRPSAAACISAVRLSWSTTSMDAWVTCSCHCHT